jgi:sugar phosphate isomerase/epimerase
MTAGELISYAVRKKISRLQFADNFPLHELSEKELDHLAGLAVENNIQLEVGMRGLEFDHTLSYLRLAEKFDSPFIRVVTDGPGFEPDRDAVIDTIVRLLPFLDKSGIVLAIENHDRFAADTLKQIIRRTSLNLVGICLDTVNSIGANEGLGQILPVLLPYTINLHIKDFAIQRVPDKMGFLVKGTPAGEGMLEIPGLLNEVRAYGKCLSATLEIWMDQEGTIEETVAKEKKWVERSLDYLKKYIA